MKRNYCCAMSSPDIELSPVVKSQIDLLTVILAELKLTQDFYLEKPAVAKMLIKHLQRLKGH